MSETKLRLSQVKTVGGFFVENGGPYEIEILPSSNLSQILIGGAALVHFDSPISTEDTVLIETSEADPFRISDGVNTVTFNVTEGGSLQISALDVASFVSGTMDTARLGSGTADTTKFLRGDSTWSALTSTETIEVQIPFIGATKAVKIVNETPYPLLIIKLGVQIGQISDTVNVTFYSSPTAGADADTIVGTGTVVNNTSLDPLTLSPSTTAYESSTAIDTSSATIGAGSSIAVNIELTPSYTAADILISITYTRNP